MRKKIVLTTLIAFMFIVPVSRARINMTQYDLPLDFFMRAETIEEMRIEHVFGSSEHIDTKIHTIWSTDDKSNFKKWHNITDEAEYVNINSTSNEDTYSTGEGAWIVHIKGLDENYNEIEEELKIQGTTQITTNKKYIRVNHFCVKDVGSENWNIGTIYATYNTTNNLCAVILPEKGEASMCIYTIPANYTGYMYGSGAHTSEKREFLFELTYRLYNKSWVKFGRVWCLDGQSFYYDYPKVETLPEKTDVQIVAKASRTNSKGSAYFTLMLIENGYPEITDTTIYDGKIMPEANMLNTILLFIITVIQLMYLVRGKI